MLRGILLYDTNISKLYITSYLFVSNGLIFMDACNGESAHEFFFNTGYHLVLLIGMLNVFEFAIKGNRCDASKLVNEVPQHDYIFWSTLILQVAREK